MEVAIGKTVTVTSEDRAWSLLREALSGGGVPADLEVRVGEVQGIHIHVKGRDLDGTVPARYLPALLEYQEAIHRLYSYVKYKEYSVRRLTDEDRRAVEIVYRVDKGSSSFGAQLAPILEKIGVEAASKMNGQQLLIFLSLSVVLLAGVGGLKLWLNYKKEKLGGEVQGAAIKALADVTKALAEGQKENADLELEKLKLLKKALKSSKAAKLVLETADSANARLAFSMDPEDTLMVGGVEVAGDEFKRAATAPREKSIGFDEAGPAVLTYVDNTIGDGYAVGVKFLNSTSAVVAKVENNRLIDEERKCLAEAVISRQPIYIHVDGKWHRGNVVRARILSIRSLSEVERKAIQKKLADGGVKAG